MISSQPAIPLLVHEDCMGDIKTGLTDQQATLSEIEKNTKNAADTLRDIDFETQQTNVILSNNINNKLIEISDSVSAIETNTSSIKASSSNTATATSSLYSSVGTTADASTENTVIGLLKSISNKITTF